MPGTTILSQSGPGSHGNEEVRRIPQSSRNEAPPSDCLLSYIKTLIGGAGFYRSFGVFHSPVERVNGFK